MLSNWSVLVCIVLLQLGNVHNAELSGVKGKRSDLPFIGPYPAPDGKPDRRNQGQRVDYFCRIRAGKSDTTLIFEQKRRDSESWGPVLGHMRFHRGVTDDAFVYAKLEFNADSKLHNGTNFRCLVKENPTNPEPAQFDRLEVLNIDHSTLNPSLSDYINQTTLGPSNRVAPDQITARTTSDQITTDRTTTDQTTADQTATDQIPTDRSTSDWTNVILYITSGVTGCILIIIMAEIIMRRCNRPSGEGHVDTSTPQQQVDDTANDMLSIYEELDDDSDSDNVSNPVRNIETGLLHNMPIHKDIEAGADTTAYMDMEAGKGKDTTPYMDMEAGKGKDTTPYMDMGAGIEEDTYMSTEGAIRDDTTPVPSAEGDKDADQYMNPEALETTYLQLTEDTDEPVEDDVELYSYATVEYKAPYMNMEAAKGIDTTPYIDMEAEKKE
ncbi:uncharacterized protein LOC141906813 [Tubulanus polymorphus]|uniref:uncharacterized protein LOC141906813 n=1 Tax=Tubulanus polymorphus TaxID=672921 RepID=UPI003DA2D326